MIDSPYRVKPGRTVKLKDFATDDTGKFEHRKDCEDESDKNRLKLRKIQDVLYAESRRSLLVVLQAMDAGGKDGTIDYIFSGINPQGCQVTSFKVPSALEKSHDFLWRIHTAAPHDGMIGIFNRSHYESVLVERIHEIVPKSVWKKRYDHINAFEQMLSDEGTRVVKFFLHISKKEQLQRIQARLDDPQKNWKYNPDDLTERKRWDEYNTAFEDLLGRCSTDDCPWYVVPSDHKWYRNWVISDILVRTLKDMNPKYPDPIPNIDKIKL